MKKTRKQDAAGQRGQAVVRLREAGEVFTPCPFLLIHEQSKTERMLLADLKGLGKDVAWNTEAIALAQHAEAVSVTVREAGGREEVLQAQWVIGADGVSSFVRQALDLKFEGKGYDRPLFLADVDMVWYLPRDKFYAQLTHIGFLGFFAMRGTDYGKDQYRIVGTLP